MTDAPEVTAATRAHHKGVLESLPFEDRSDFEDAARGLIATWEGDAVPRSDGNPSWDIKAHEYIAGECPPTVNPSLWRQAQLNNIHGLFKVCDGLYQVRGYDLANISFVEGKTGWIVIDAGMTQDAAAAALTLVCNHVADKPVTGLIYTHSHVDHYGGARAILEEEDALARKVPIIAPFGFLEEAVSENVIAGATMRRRATYMYGLLLPNGPEGHVDTGLGPGSSSGIIGLVAPNDIIEKTGETRTVDGVEIHFQFTPDAEAPAEMMFYFPGLKALCTSEVVTHILHNVYTPRGAKVRDAQAWSKYIGELMQLFPDAEIVFASHHWPIWGEAKVYEYLGSQRDLYKYLHDETLRLANHGLTPIEIAEEIKLPESLATRFWNRDYYGTVNHNVKAIYQLYFGWYDGNAANLHKHTPVEAGKRYLAFMGGADAVVEKASGSFDEGDYRWVAEVLNHVVFAEPDHTEARALLARAHTQMAYQAESGPWRDFYLTAAQELKNGAPGARVVSNPGSLETIKAIPIGLLFDYLAVRLNGPKAAGHTLTLNFVFTGSNEKVTATIGNGVLNHTVGAEDAKAAATLSVPREVWNKAMAGLTPLAELLDQEGTSVSGDPAALQTFFGLLDEFQIFFNIVEP